MRSHSCQRSFGWFATYLLLCLIGLESSADTARPLDTPAAAFGSLPTMWDVRISPSGSKIVFLTMHADDRPLAAVYDFTTGKSQPVLVSEKDRFEVYRCGWASEDRLLCGFYAIYTDAHVQYPVTRMVAVDADAKNMKVLMQHKLERTWAQYQDQVVDWLPEDDDHVLITRPESNGTGVARLNIRSGSLENVQRPRPRVYTWMGDRRGSVRLRFSIKRDRYEWHHRPLGQKKWHLLDRRKHEEIFASYRPVGFSEDPDRIMVVKDHEGRRALFEQDLGDGGETKLVFSHPDANVGGVHRVGKYDRIVAISYSTDRRHLHYFDDAVREIADRIETAFPGQLVEVIDESWDRRFYIIRVSNDKDPGSFYRFDATKSELVLVSRQNATIQKDSLAPTTTLEYEARDGVEITGYLTRPIASNGDPSPAVVLPHGGPQGSGNWGYDWLTQFLVARGYVVLQSKFRVASELERDWLGVVGYRDWQSTVDDLTDGARYLVEQGVADPRRMCVLGWGYGGYAALLSAIEEPGLYRCAVSIAGVSDLPTLVDDRRRVIGWQTERDYIGTNAETLRVGSPARRAAEFSVPVLLFHGDEDILIEVQQSEKMAESLRDAKKKVEFVEYEEVDHSIERSQLRIDMLERIGDFLDRNTGPVVPAE